MLLRIAAVLFAALTLMVATGCPQEIVKGAAISGPKKYKAEVLSTMTQINGEIANGVVSDGSIAKLESQLNKWEGEMGSKGSFIKAKEVLNLLKKSKSDPGSAFMSLQEAKTTSELVVDYFKTEVTD